MQACQTDSRTRGIGQYASSLLRELVQNHGKKFEFHLLLNASFYKDKVINELLGLVDKNNIHVWSSVKSTSLLVENQLWKKKASEIIKENLVLKINPDVFFIFSHFEGLGDDAASSCEKIERSGISVFAIIYDLIPLIFEKKYLSSQVIREWYERQLSDLKRFDKLFAISESTKKDITRYLKIDEHRVINISGDVDAQYKKITLSDDYSEKVRDKYNIKRKYLFFTGVISDKDPRKNVDVLVKAYINLPGSFREEFQLVLCGQVDDEFRQNVVNKLENNACRVNDCIFTGYVSDKELIALYSNSALFVFPSLYEGFGLPVLEAMWCDVPVVCSNTSSMKEIMPYEHATFNPLSIHELVNILLRFQQESEFRLELKKISQQQKHLFSWKKVAEKIVDTLESFEYKKKMIPDVSLDNVIQDIVAIEADHLDKHDLEWVSLSINETFGSDNRDKQLFVDVTVLYQYDANTGIQRTVKKILHGLMMSGLESINVVPVRREAGLYKYANRILSKSDQLDKEIIDILPGDIFLGLDLDAEPDVNAYEFLSYHRFRGLKVYFVVYDLIPINYPQWFEPSFSNLFHEWFTKITHLSDGVICISKSVCHQYERWYKHAEINHNSTMNLGYFYLGADIISNENQYTQKSGELAQMNFLMVGTLEPRKGVDQVLDAFIHLWKTGYNFALHIVGKEGWLVNGLVEKIKTHSEYGQLLQWHEGISDQALVGLYRDCNCLIAASYEEGYGLPIIESALHHLPVIARDIPVFREVAAHGAFYFEGDSHQQLSEDILKWVKLFENNAHPSPNKITIKTWQQSTDQLLNVIMKNSWYKTLPDKQLKSFQCETEAMLDVI